MGKRKEVIHLKSHRRLPSEQKVVNFWSDRQFRRQAARSAGFAGQYRQLNLREAGRADCPCAGRSKVDNPPADVGPRSLMRTITERPLCRFVTLTFVPNGRLLWAAVSAEAWAYSPFAVFSPL